MNWRDPLGWLFIGAVTCAALLAVWAADMRHEIAKLRDENLACEARVTDARARPFAHANQAERYCLCAADTKGGKCVVTFEGDRVHVKTDDFKPPSYVKCYPDADVYTWSSRVDDETLPAYRHAD